MWGKVGSKILSPNRNGRKILWEIELTACSGRVDLLAYFGAKIPQHGPENGEKFTTCGAFSRLHTCI
jgi:hypothetical protein